MIRNSTIDTVKLFAAIGVMLIHLSISMPENYVTNDYTLAAYYIGRFAVPFFFITSGYYVTNYQKALIKIMKLYVFFMCLSVIANIILLPFNLSVFGAIQWYFIAYASLLIILAPKNRLWWNIVLVSSVVYNIVVNFLLIDLNSTLGGIELHNNAIVYAMLFIIGNKLRTQDFTKIDKRVGYGLLILGLIMSIYNALYALYDQFMLFSQLSAIIIFLGAMISATNKRTSFAIYSEDIFLYHCLFLFIPKLLTTQSLLLFYIYMGIIPVFCVYTGKLFRYLDEKYWSGYIFKKSALE